MPTFFGACGPKNPVTAPIPANPFFSWFGIDEAMIAQVMAELTSRGADDADIYFQHRRSNSINMEDGLISSAQSSIDQGVGLRVVIGDQTGFAFTEDLSLEAMLAAAGTAATIAQGTEATSPEKFIHRPQTSGFYSVEVPWGQVGVDEKLPLIERLEGMARGGDPAVEKVTISWSDQEDRVLVADLGGRIQTDIRPMARIFCNITAKKDGVTQSNGANIAGRQGIKWYTDDQLKLVATQAIDRTMVLFDAKRPPAGELPVVLAAGASGILLHEAIGHGMEADFNRKGISIFSDMIGKKVAPEFVTIVDSGVVDNERGALNFDDEGNECERTVLVENGVLKSFLHDNISARHYNVPTTGSGRRQSFRHAPMPRMRCTYMEDGPASREDIIASVKKGIIAETFTNGQVQIGAGDYTFYIKNGWMIEDGKTTFPIKDCNIIGNGPESLERVTMVANDSKLDTGGWTCGKNGQRVPVSQGLPTVLVSAMTVGGVDA
ncbi:MAG: TldD/PmbA family protein [Proteobacteria bacterium]|nr:TldD/PmbA family protein [Pseudomonadota bacterium]